MIIKNKKIINGKKKCSKCGINKDLDEFYFRKNRSIYESSCKKCCLLSSKESLNKPANKIKYKIRQKIWKDNNGERIYQYNRSAHLKQRYGITINEYNDLLVKQNVRCAICDSTNTKDGKAKKFYIDHDHKTGKIRGLLCRHCNLLLGFSNDDVNILLKSINYLLRHKL
jgi:hypothetical protein